MKLISKEIKQEMDKVFNRMEPKRQEVCVYDWVLLCDYNPRVFNEVMLPLDKISDSFMGIESLVERLNDD
jgi:hypothetical protein